MGEAEIGEFLTSLAVEGKIAATTQNQALSALLFLYRHVGRKGDANGAGSGSSPPRARISMRLRTMRSPIDRLEEL
jgi:hypothetical protein